MILVRKRPLEYQATQWFKPGDHIAVVEIWKRLLNPDIPDLGYIFAPKYNPYWDPDSCEVTQGVFEVVPNIIMMDTRPAWATTFDDRPTGWLVNEVQPGDWILTQGDSNSRISKEDFIRLYIEV